VKQGEGGITNGTYFVAVAGLGFRGITESGIIGSLWDCWGL